MPELGLKIDGYADNQGGEAEKDQNMYLSVRRAAVAKEYINQYMIENDIDETTRNSVLARITTQGHGAVVDGTGDNPNNRRADITITKADGSSAERKWLEDLNTPYLDPDCKPD